MKYSLFVALAVVASSLTGCGGQIPKMNNDMIIMEALKCEQAGLPWRQNFNYDGSVREVVCSPHMLKRTAYERP